MILKVLIIFDPKLNLFKSDAYIFMQQSRKFLAVSKNIGSFFGFFSYGINQTKHADF
jgi:hypothetical protein